MFRRTGSVTGGFIDGAREARLELLPLLWAFAPPAGRVTADAYRDLKSEFLARLKAVRLVDGLLDLHGAMVVEGIDDAEGDLLAALRSEVGRVPIISTLDLHTNITAQMAATADVLISFDTYRHGDMYDRGLEAYRPDGPYAEGAVPPLDASAPVADDCGPAATVHAGASDGGDHRTGSRLGRSGPGTGGKMYG